MPFLRGVYVPHVLEAEEVAYFARRNERGRAEIAGEESQSVKGDGGQLGVIRYGLLEVVLAASAAFAAWTSPWPRCP